MAAESRELRGAWNFRDVADTAETIAPGRLLRSSELSRLDDDGRATLHRLQVTDVADLRSRREVARRGPGRVPGDVDIHLLPFPDLAADRTDGDQTAPHEQAFRKILAEQVDGDTAAGLAARYMTEEYRRFPALPGSLRAVRQVVTLLDSGRSVLTHCFAGKDRTGFVVAVVLAAAGIDPDAIMADYLRSNAAVPKLREQIMEMIRQRPDTEITPEVATFTEARLSDEVLGVREEYLDTARRAIDQQYGSLDGYLRAAEVAADDVARLRDVLTG